MLVFLLAYLKHTTKTLCDNQVSEGILWVIKWVPSFFSVSGLEVVVRLAWPSPSPFAHLAASSCWRNSWTTSLHLWDGLALFKARVLSMRQRSLLPFCSWPTMSLWLSAAFACLVVYDGVHFLPVAREGAAWATNGSLESDNNISSLTLVHLYSSSRLEMGSSKIPLP